MDMALIDSIVIGQSLTTAIGAIPGIPPELLDNSQKHPWYVLASSALIVIPIIAFVLWRWVVRGLNELDVTKLSRLQSDIYSTTMADMKKAMSGLEDSRNQLEGKYNQLVKEVLTMGRTIHQLQLTTVEQTKIINNQSEQINLATQELAKATQELGRTTKELSQAKETIAKLTSEIENFKGSMNGKQN